VFGENFSQGKVIKLMVMQEHFFQCPYCWEEISMLLDTSVRKQTYIEDCEICCNPIEISVGFENNELLEFDARNIEQ
jgi:transcription elongation factor Elf1